MKSKAHKKTVQGKVVYEPLEEHLFLVKEYANEFAKKLGLPSTLTRAALWHDLGKNCQLFEKRLDGGDSFDHSCAGAKWSIESPEGSGPMATLLKELVAYAIAGHHVGMPNGRVPEKGQETLAQILSKTETQHPKDGEIPFWRDGIPETILHPPDPWESDLSRFFGNISTQDAKWAAQLLGRMIFSCLVDADFLATEEYMKGKRNLALGEGRGRGQHELAGELERYVSSLEKNAVPTGINEGRKRLRAEVWAKAGAARGFKQLKVPTGGGKTFLSIGYSLLHNAATSPDGRVIYAAPYTTILDEVCETLESALGFSDQELVVHHHNIAEERDTQTNRLLSENWDAGIILTSHAQLVDSLLSNKPGKCRKLHNLIGSTIIIDEVQSLPLHMLKPILGTLKLLVLQYGVTVILCSATQIPVSGEWLGNHRVDKIEDLAPQAGSLLFQSSTKRTKETFLGKLPIEEVARVVMQKERVLCIVNTRQYCRKLFNECRRRGGAALYHLSTWMTPVDRLRILGEIRSKLKSGQQVKVISTSLIEAGVNLDFPSLMRELTGMSSVAQGAGRCNREGRMTEPGEVCIFETDGYQQEDIRELGILSKVANQQTSEWIDEKSVELFFDLLFKRIGENIEGDGFDEAGLTSKVQFRNKDGTVPKIDIGYQTLAAASCVEDSGGSVCALDLGEWDKLEKSLEAKGYATRKEKRHIQQNSFSMSRGDLRKWLEQGRIVESPTTGILRLTDPNADYCRDTGARVGEEDANPSLLTI